MYTLMGAASYTYLLGQPHLSLVPWPVLGVGHLCLLALVLLPHAGSLQGQFLGITKDCCKLHEWLFFRLYVNTKVFQERR
jgi:hypothetical protein